MGEGFVWIVVFMERPYMQATSVNLDAETR